MATLWVLVTFLLQASSCILAREIHETIQNAFNEIAYPVIHHDVEDHDVLRGNVQDVSVLLGLNCPSCDKSFQNVRELLMTHGLGVLDKRSIFSIYDKSHVSESDAMFEILSSAASFSDFIDRARILRVYMNPGLYNYALRSVLLQAENEEFKQIEVPELFNVAARNFFTDETIAEAIQLARQSIPENKPASSSRPETGDEWARFFTDDIGLNAFHHTTMLKTMPKVSGHAHAVLFINARYNAERIAVNLPAVKPLDFTKRRIIIQDGYAPHLSSYTGEKRLTVRPDYMELQDDTRDLEHLHSVSELRTIHGNLKDAIRRGSFTDRDGNGVPLTFENLIETVKGPPERNVNPKLYGTKPFGLLGHRLLSIITDPNGRYSQDPGAFGIATTTLRDPVAYQWHATLMELYDKEFKMTLPSYSEDDLHAPVVVESVKIQMDKSHSHEGLLETFMEERTVDITMDPSVSSQVDDSGPVEVLIERLNHKPFHYHIELDNQNRLRDFTAAVRIFITPSEDEAGDHFKSLNEQRQFAIEMDKFVVKLNPGKNVIRRSSELSSFTHLVLLTPDEKIQYKNEAASNRRLNCGWPLNLLVPRGTSSGMDFDVFVMVTDWNKDHTGAGQDDVVVNLDNGVALCGVEGSHSNPDGRSAGFPFDRKFQETSLSEFSAKYSNMLQSKVTIQHIHNVE